MYIPVLGPLVPRKWGIVARTLGRALLIICRWRIKGEVHNAPKIIFVMAPHTSWWDFTNNLGVMLSTGIKASWFIADKYTWWPISSIVRWLGGVPVERSSRRDLVSQMANHIQESEHFVLAIFPEGTRKKVSKWKTGFWYIAKQSDIPIQLVSVDYARQSTIFGPVLVLSENMDEDLKRIQEHFRDVSARYPEKFGAEFL